MNRQPLKMNSGSAQTTIGAISSDGLTLPAEQETMTQATTDSVSVNRWTPQASTAADDLLAEEVAVALCYNGTCHLVMMASPSDLADFALGFSLSEGILQSPDELYDLSINPCAEGIEVNLTISTRRAQVLKQQKRNLTGRTGCGLCGADSLKHAIRPVSRITPQAPISDAAIQRAVAQLDANQPLQQQTGAVHGAAWCNAEGEIVQLKEDVGRHNAMDKLIGSLVHSNSDFSQGFLLISSRASYEIVHKAAAIGIGNLVAVSAPTALAIRLAKQANINVTGFARNNRHVRYSQAQQD
ncbi:MAG: formate dehydrogenase accessory sulfurtransferase FdhD [Motiliproteus sp.]